eukprot:scpid94704/ scgid35485/ 
MLAESKTNGNMPALPAGLEVETITRSLPQLVYNAKYTLHISNGLSGLGPCFLVQTEHVCTHTLHGTRATRYNPAVGVLLIARHTTCAYRLSITRRTAYAESRVYI